MTINDITRVDVADVEQQITQRVDAIAERRSVIDQAKGMLMFTHGVDAEDAFDLLRGQSQQHNVKLADFAAQVIDALVELSRSKSTIDRNECQRLLVTAHQRVGNVAVRHRKR